MKRLTSHGGKKMKRKVLCGIGFIFLIMSVSLFGQWAETIGQENDDSAVVVCPAKNGEYLVAGHTSGDVWILKLTDAGSLRWGRTYGGSGDDKAVAMEETSDGCYIVAGQTDSFGAGSYDFWVLKLSSNGGIKWQKAYGGSSSDLAYAIQETIDGGYIIAGSTWSFGEGGSDIWILKLNPEGVVEWQKTYGGSLDDGAYSLGRTIDGGYIVAGYTRSAGGGSNSMWVIKLTADGYVEWQHAYGESKDDYAYSVKEILDGGYIVAGYTYSFGAGSADCWVIKLRHNGKIEWQKTYGGIDEDKALCIRQDKDLGFIVAGQSYSFGIDRKGSYDPELEGEFLVFKLKADGSVKWQKIYGGNYSWDYGQFIRQTTEGGYIAVGETCSWGAGGKDIFILKLLSNGNVTSSCRFIRNISTTIMNTTVSPHKTNCSPRNSEGRTEDTNSTWKSSSQKQYVLGGVKCSLDISIPFGGGTTEPSAGTHAYNAGTQVILKATPSSEYFFSGWIGNFYSDSSDVKIMMDGDKSVEANFYYNQPGGGEWGDGGSYNKSGCFIATAAYNSPYHPHVRILRRFRDRYLLPTSLGRKFVKAYYRWSPGVASLISKHGILKALARVGLFPFVGLSFLLIHLGLTGTGIGLAVVFGLPFIFIWKRKRKKKRVKKMIKNQRISSVAIPAIIILFFLHFIHPTAACQEIKKQKPFPFSLVGIILAKNGPSCAVLKNNFTGETLFLNTQESIDGMQIIKISEDRIILQKADSTLQIFLESKHQIKETFRSFSRPGITKSESAERNSGENNFGPQSPLVRELTWPEIEGIMETDLPVLIRESRGIPNMVHGKFQGFRVIHLPKTSFLSHGEIQVNDIIRFINDVELDGFPTLLSLLPRLKSEMRLSIILEREGQRLQRTWRLKEITRPDQEKSIR